VKRIGELWAQVVSFGNLLRAYRKARRGKARGAGVAEFGLDLERELLHLQADLASGDYRPGAYRLFTLYERKPRTIAAAPFRDRVVHHALMNLIEPPLDRTFIHDSYACRKGKGAHAAVDRYQRWARRYRYALKMDIARYFPSIDHGLLKQKLRRRIKDEKVLALLDLLIATSPQLAGPVGYFPGDDLLTPIERRTGMPIGNLTSQFFANLYLDDLDHWLKERLGVAAYLRYVDDMAVLGDDKGRLAEVRDAVRERLARDRLQLHPRKAHVTRTRDGLDLLGYIVYPDFRLLRNDNGHRFSRKLRRFAKDYADRRLSRADFDPAVQSWIGHARHADTEGLRRRIFSATIFQRGAGREAASV
jgi:RNA-directed DNA polymerase